MMQKSIAFAVSLALIICASQSTQAATITGNPVTDGWTFGGNSLANGTYVRGEGTFSFDIYSAAFEVAAGSNLQISAGSYSWLPGDQIIGLGGKFVSTTAADAGWSAFQPNPYNSGDGVAPNDDVSGSTRPVAKFGTADSNFTTSTTAPFQNGNGNGNLEAPSGNGGDGAILARITNNRTSANAGQVQLPDLVNRYSDTGALLLSTGSSNSPVVINSNFRNVARLMYTWSNQFDPAGHIATWQFVLNLSLMERVFPYDAYPQAGDQAIMAVQRSTNRYTDGLVEVVPEPASFAIWLLLGASAILYYRRRR